MRFPSLQLACLCWWTSLGSIRAFMTTTPSPQRHVTTTPLRRNTSLLKAANTEEEDDGDDDKFGFVQRVDSVKSLVVGAVVGSLAAAVPEAVHTLLLSPLLMGGAGGGLAQFEFDGDAAAVATGLFAVAYRYGVRRDGATNPRLPQGVVGAFVVTRTVSRVTLPSYCTALTLHCGPPLGILDWNVLGQLAVNGVESLCMYAATAYALEACMERGWISRFPG